jgi:5-methylcytosine-specific restriction endonuclease McrA
MISKTCVMCGRVFEVYPYRTITSKYCSHKCLGQANHKRGSKERHCKNCGKLFTTHNSQFRYYLGAGSCCSKKCTYDYLIKKAAKRPIKDKYQRTNRKADKEWVKAIRAKYNKCLRCSATSAVLHAHHVKSRARYPELKYDPSNGILLCNSCHTWVHNHPKEAHLGGWYYLKKYAEVIS